MDRTENETPRRAPERRARRLRRLLRRGAAGMTLIEIMVVVIIMGLIASAVGVNVFNQLKRARIRTTEQAIEAVRSAVQLYQNDHPDGCPTIEQLTQGRFLDANRSSTDAWNRAFRISCDNNEVSVSSAGPDGQFGTDDDLPATRQGGGGGGGNH